MQSLHFSHGAWNDDDEKILDNEMQSEESSCPCLITVLGERCLHDMPTNMNGNQNVTKNGKHLGIPDMGQGTRLSEVYEITIQFNPFEILSKQLSENKSNHDQINKQCIRMNWTWNKFLVNNNIYYEAERLLERDLLFTDQVEHFRWLEDLISLIFQLCRIDRVVIYTWFP